MVTALLLMKRPHAWGDKDMSGTHTHTPSPQGRKQRRRPYLIERGHKAGVVVEGRHDEGVILLMDVQRGLNVHLGVLRRQEGGRGKRSGSPPC